MVKYKTIYELKNTKNELKILGANNNLLYLIEDFLQIEIVIRHGAIMIDEKYLAHEQFLITLFSTLEKLLDKGITILERDIINILHQLKSDRLDELMWIYENREHLITTVEGKQISPQTINQKMYLKALNEYDIVFAIGPAGTGKTYLAVLYAVSMLRKNKIRKIILVRPAVEAGEKLGFLPGDLKEKVDPYLVPLYDALNEGLGKETVDKMIEKGIIEVAPLAYMRGRTLDNSIIILDEAQNTTTQQMKMFLTRLGFNSKMIITGDITQIDLPHNVLSGLVEAMELLKDVRGIKIISFDSYDVMRHPLVHKIIQKYEGR